MKFVAKGVMPNLLHVIPVRNNSVFKWVLKGQYTSLALGFVSDVAVFLTHTYHDSLQLQKLLKKITTIYLRNRCYGKNSVLKKQAFKILVRGFLSRRGKITIFLSTNAKYWTIKFPVAKFLGVSHSPAVLELFHRHTKHMCLVHYGCKPSNNFEVSTNVPFVIIISDTCQQTLPHTFVGFLVFIL